MKPILFLIILSALFYGIWRINSPYPNPLNWDLWEHQTVINAIRHGSYALFPSQLSNTFQFDGYTTIFHTTIAVLQNLMYITNILGFWWIGEGVFFVLSTLAAYFFVLALTKNKMTAVIGGILSAGFFESASAFTTLFLLPQTVAALLWVIGMSVVVLQKTRKSKIIVAAGFSVLILPFHFIVGALGTLALFAMALELNIHWIIALVVSYIIPTLVAPYLTHVNAGEAQYYMQSIPEKLAAFRQWYGLLPIPFLVIGIWKGNKTLSMLLAGFVGLLLSPFPYVFKFAVLFHYVLVTVMAVGVAYFVKPRAVVLALITIAVGGIFYANTTAWKQPVVFRGIASHISFDEQEAAVFLKNHFADALLVSDPATQNILEPLSGVHTLGGAYMSVQNRENLLENKFEPGTLFAISARTMKWLRATPADQMSVAFNIWRPDALSMNDMLYIQSLGYEEVYKNASIVILKI